MNFFLPNLHSSGSGILRRRILILNVTSSIKIFVCDSINFISVAINDGRTVIVGASNGNFKTLFKFKI